MASDFIYTVPFSPIKRLTPNDRVVLFTNNESAIYNRNSPYYQAGGDLGFDQPYVYTKLTDSNLSKNLTRYDSQALPIGSTVRDVVRVGKFIASGTGILFIGKQYLLQQSNAFNETRIYNPVTLLGATAKTGTLGLTDRPQRHLRTGGGILNFFKDSLLSSVGFETKDWSKEHIEGTAGTPDNSALPTYVKVLGGGPAGLMRLPTAMSADTRFSTIWTPSPGGNEKKLGFLENLKNSLIKAVNKYIPSTNPLGILGGSPTKTWKYRIEYPDNKAGIYDAFLEDSGRLLTSKQIPSGKFYNDDPLYDLTNPDVLTVGKFHKYNPLYIEGTGDTKDKWYAPTKKISSEANDIEGSIGVYGGSNIKNAYNKYFSALDSYKNEAPQFRKSAERYTENKDKAGNVIIGKNNNYDAIPNSRSENKFTNYLKDELTLDSRGFSKSSGSIDPWDKLGIEGPTKKKRDEEIYAGMTESGNAAKFPDQSPDIIFFYFYDIVNGIYIPFRATFSSITDTNNPEWDEISYMGRADKLYAYKGFSREVSFNFRVYVSSIKELIPMWDRINYLVGLTRPSKYTDKAFGTNQNPLAGTPSETTGNESSFIYPPMMTFRIGDLYVDQPAILRACATTIPEDAMWETVRGKDYSFTYGIEKKFKYDGQKTRQLPTIADISVTMALLEKRQSLTSNNHYGNFKYDQSGNILERWAL